MEKRVRNNRFPPKGVPILLLTILLVFKFALLFGSQKEKNVLVIHSYHQGLEWTDSITAGIYSVFNDKPEFNIYMKYLDTKVHSSEEYLEALFDFYQTQVAKVKYEAIIASDNAAYNFLIKYRDILFPDVPVFFSGVNYLNKEELKTLEKFYGYEELADHRGTLKMLNHFFPERNKVIIINDNTLTGRSIRKELEVVLPEFDGVLDFEFYTDFSLEELKQKVYNLDEQSIIYLLVVNRDKNGKFVSYKKGMQVISDNSNVPIFGTWDFYLGKGIVGGSIMRGSELGRDVANLTLDYLVRDIVPSSAHQVGESTPCLDYEIMQKFGIEKVGFANSIKVINRPERMSQLVKSLIVIIGILMLLLLITFVYLYFRRVQNVRLVKLVDEKTSELQGINDRLKRIITSKNEIIGVVAHDLRNPIGNIHGFCDFVIEEDNEKGILDVEMRSCLDTIQEVSSYMLNLVNSLLDISVIESGIVKLNLVRQDYIAFLKSEIRQTKALAVKRELDLILVERVDSVELNFDKLKMHQVHTNIIGNAMKYSKPGDTIRVVVCVQDNKVITRIEDQGPGIPADKCDAIFGKFVQLENNSNVTTKGAGLGLSIVKGIIEAHKGKIYVESEVGVGTSFIYELPIDS